MMHVEELILPAPRTAAPEPERGSIFFVGTATVVLRYAGFTILTDPSFLQAGVGEHPEQGAPSGRSSSPAIAIEALPRLDLCLLSHYDAEHFDRIAADRLRKDLPIVTSAHAAARLQKRGFTALLAVEAWESVAVRKGGATLRLTAMPGRHAASFASALRSPFIGCMLEFQPFPGRTALRLYVTGDTLSQADLDQIARRYPGVDLTLFHLGSAQALGLLLARDAAENPPDPPAAMPCHADPAAPAGLLGRGGAAGCVRFLASGETYPIEVVPGRIELGH